MSYSSDTLLPRLYFLFFITFIISHHENGHMKGFKKQPKFLNLANKALIGCSTCHPLQYHLHHSLHSPNSQSFSCSLKLHSNCILISRPLHLLSSWNEMPFPQVASCHSNWGHLWSANQEQLQVVHNETNTPELSPWHISPPDIFLVTNSFAF